MVDPQASRFWLAALQSGLLEAQALNACWEGISPEKRNAPEHLDRRLARQAVQQNHLTLWQAQQLLAGRTSGFRVDRYLLLDLIGHGGMGRVYLARDTRLGRQVALKILSPERMSNPRAIARFRREARVGAQLQHENLVRIYDFGESQGRYFLVMEYIEGKTIGALISEQGPMPPATAARLARQIALGLEHAHRKGLIHRDVNPYNVLVTHEGVAKLADLGLAKDLTEDERVTREGATVGTFDYVAPEQARQSDSADIRSDVYSLGCTLYHMIAGQVPFPSPSLPEKLFAHQALEPRPLDQVVPEIPAGLAEAVRRMMRKRPEERYATPLQAAQAIEPFVEEYARLNDTQPEPSPLIPDDGPGRRDAPQPSAEDGAEGPSPAVARATPHPGGLTAGGTRVAPGGQPSDRIAPAFVTPVNDREASSAEDIPLLLDLGPEPSLTDSLSRPKPWFSTDRSSNAQGGVGSDAAVGAPDRRSALLASLSRSRWAWPVAILALALVLAITLGILGYFWGGPGMVGTDKAPPRRAAAGRQDEAGLKGHPRAVPAEDALAKAEADRTPAADITVRDPNGQEEPAKNLKDAIDRALGVNGWVILHNPRPLSVPPAPSLAPVASGALRIRAAEGVKPTLEVELVAGKPVLSTGLGAKLVLEGLTIVARSSKQVRDAAARGASAPGTIPVVQAAGSAEFRRCTFAVDAADQAARSVARAIVTEGVNLTIEGCWFRGFDTAVVVREAGGQTAQIRQTLATAGTRDLPDRPAAAAPAPRPGARPRGWLIEVEHLGGGKVGSPRQVILEHCTLVGDGLLKLSRFSPQSPIQVKASGCAFQARTLIGWEPWPADAALSPTVLQWEGEGNLYDIRDRAWIEAPGAKAPPGPAANVASLIDWGGLVKESGPREDRIAFPPAGAGVPVPKDFEIKPQGDQKIGADPDLVGPGRPPADPVGAGG
ncbi:MAG: protein kinase [Isosphaeraceae bacterium]